MFLLVMSKNMIKISIYILLTITLVGCAGLGSFKGKTEGTVVDSRGNIVSLEEDMSAKELFYLATGALKRGQYDLAAENYRKIEANHPFSNLKKNKYLNLYHLKIFDDLLVIVWRLI